MINGVGQIEILTRLPRGYQQPRQAENAVAANDAIGDFLDLSAPSRELYKIYEQPANFKESFLTQLAELLARGIVGTETIEMGAEKVERFVTTGIGSEDRLARRLDIRA